MQFAKRAGVAYEYAYPFNSQTNIGVLCVSAYYYNPKYDIIPFIGRDNMEHKCTDCGYLANRNKKTRQLEEVEADVRKTGLYPFEASEIYDKPICFAQAYDLSSEQWKVHRGQRSPSQAIDGDLGISPADTLKVITDERGCNSFTKWQQGFAPKEIREMMDREKFLELQAKQRRDDKIWRIIEIIILVFGAGLFTVLGAWLKS